MGHLAIVPTALTIAALGLLLGMRHATDSDHVIAVTTIISREKSTLSAAIVGALWGFGHTMTITIVGAAIILFKMRIPPRLGLTMELLVACMLILLGALNLTGLMAQIMKWLGSGAHAHIIMGHIVVHRHDWNQLASERGTTFLGLRHWSRQLGAFHVIRPIVVGLVHGLAGSAAVALLVLTTIKEPRWAVGYLIVFGIGTIIGMMLITTAIALPFTYTMRNFSRLNQGLALASGAISLSFGLLLFYQIGIVEGLFTVHPTWTPH